MQSVETARNNYAQATSQAAQVAAAALYASFPEVTGLTAEQLPVALQILARQNPQRHAQITQHLNQTRALYGAAQQAQQQAQAAQWQDYATKLDHYTKQHEAAFEQSISSESPEVVKEVKANFLDVAEKNYGVSRNDLAQAFRDHPILRTAQFQRMMFDATRYQIAKRGVSERAPPAVPHVQRPGVSKPAPSSNDSAVSDAREAFRENPTPRNAAAYLRAKRSAAA